jgi:hypothetical protein
MDYGWQALLKGYPWFHGAGRFPLPAYSEFMPPPRIGRKPLGAIDLLVDLEQDPCGWPVSEIEEEIELKPGLQHLAAQILGEVGRLGGGLPAHLIAGHAGSNLRDNLCWPRELAEYAGKLEHERYVILMPLALARTQDDMGRVRWTLFGGSEQGPERGFWKSFYSAPGQEWPAARSHDFILRLLRQALGESSSKPAELKTIGFRVLPSRDYPPESLPAWTTPFVLSMEERLEDVRYLLTFQPFSLLPEPVRKRYLSGHLLLLPFPGSLVLWYTPTYQRLQKTLAFASQIPLLRLAGRHGGPYGIRVPQSGWLHEPHPDVDPAHIEKLLIRDTYARTHRWRRVHRYEDELALEEKLDKVARVLFSTDLGSVGLYDKPMARNCQLWTRDFDLLLDGPRASREQIRRAEAAVVEGGLFGYRFLFPAMRVGRHEIYWHRPLVAYASPAGGAEILQDAPTGYLTAYPDDMHDASRAVELWPRILQRESHLLALRGFECTHDHYQHQTAHNLISLLDCRKMTGRPLAGSFAHHLIRTAREQSLPDWMEALPERALQRADGTRMKVEIGALLDHAMEDLPEPITYHYSATRAFEESWWQDIFLLAHGRFVNKDNADCVLDPSTQHALAHRHRDLDLLGDYLISRHRSAITAAGMEDSAVCGEQPFRWETDFDFSLFGGWKRNQEGRPCERNLLVVIPGRNRGEAVVMADHYDTAYMEDVFEVSRGGSGARLAAAGADDNHSATVTLLQAAPLFLRMARDGLLDRDIWLLHLTGEEFPSDCMGARHFCRSLVEGTLNLRVDGRSLDLSSTRVTAVLVMDMIAHNRDDARDIFQISPGQSRESLRVAEQAHLANMIWNSRTREWNRQGDRHGRGRGRRSADGKTIPEIAVHPQLRGEIRLADKPLSSLYNTDGQIFSDVGVPVVLFMENYDINRAGYHDAHDTMENIDLDYGSAVAAIAMETVARLSQTRQTK